MEILVFTMLALLCAGTFAAVSMLALFSVIVVGGMIREAGAAHSVRKVPCSG